MRAWAALLNEPSDVSSSYLVVLRGFDDLERFDFLVLGGFFVLDSCLKLFNKASVLLENR